MLKDETRCLSPSVHSAASILNDVCRQGLRETARLVILHSESYARTRGVKKGRGTGI